ncbi:hypothetical protein [Streptomyces sp. NPDC002067]
MITSSDPIATEALRRAHAADAQILLKKQLTDVAAHLTARRPSDLMTEAARMTVALGVTGTAAGAQPLLRRLPFPTGGITRGEYALRLRRSAW